LNEIERSKKELKEFRKDIDNIDDKIINLLNKRAEIVIEIGKIKKLLNLGVFQPKREEEIIQRITNKSTLLKPSIVKTIWKEIMGASKDLQGTISKVGYLGPKGTFTHQAALDFFPKTGTNFIGCKNISEIFEKIEKNLLDFGVIPIENSLQGTVRETLDLLIEKNLIIYGEIELRIVQNLISLKSSDLLKIEDIYSHPQAFAQVRTWIKTNLPNANLINMDSTAEAVKKVKELNNEKNGAIGTVFASKIQDLKILSSNIEDHPSNFTRFIIMSKKENELKGEKIKTSLVFVVKHVPGALYKALKVFSDENINLTKIESRPRRKGKWEYIFLMEFEGHKEDPKIIEVLELVNQNVIWCKILGSYPYK